jgi:hypothetical protein
MNGIDRGKNYRIDGNRGAGNAPGIAIRNVPRRQMDAI